MKKKIISLILVVVTALLLISCAQKDGVESLEADNASADVKESFSSSASLGSGVEKSDGFSADAAEPEAPASGNVTQTTTGITDGRKIIYSSSFSVETKDFDKSVAALESLCNEFGAWLESSNSYGTPDQADRTAYYNIRVPVDNYTAFVSRKDSVGVVVSSSENNRDVTEQYTDLEARLESASLREERVLEILKNAELLDDVLALERELSSIRYEIESLTGSLRKYDSLVNYATVTVTIAEVSVFTPTPKSTLTFKERLSKGFSDGIESFKENTQSFIVFLSYNFIPLIFWTLVAAGAISVITVNRKKKKTKEISEKDDEKKE